MPKPGRIRGRLSIGLSSALALFALPAAAQVYTAVVEGTVFNLRTGVPLAGAEVQIQGNVASPPGFPSPSNVVAQTRSDYNGFYALEVRTLSEPMGLQAFCATPKGRVIGGQTRTVLREGVNRRDLYVDVGWARAFRECLLVVPSAGR